MTDIQKSLYVDSDGLPWRRSPYDGVEWKKLFHDPASGESAVLLRFAPGASYGIHAHPGGEEYLVLAGSLEEGAKTYGVGSYVRHGRNSVHRPISREGCLLFVRLPRPVEEREEKNRL